MKKTFFLVICGLVAGAAALAAWLFLRKPAADPPQGIRVAATPARLERGKYLFEVVANCDVCHSERDPSRFGGPVVVSGRGKGGQFPEDDLPGKVFASNITPDPETGLGQWTDGEKIRAIRDGVSRDGRALFPLMPYKAFRYMSDEDVESVVAYMNSLPPIRHAVPTTQLDFPVSLLVKGDPRPAGRVPVPNRSNLVLYGEYLATLAECETCHTPAERGQVDVSRRFGGGRKFRFGQMSVVSANISPDPDTGIGGWSKQRFVERFQAYRGYAKNGPPEAGPERYTVMPWLQFARLTDEDIEAIYTYLMSRTPVRNPVEKRTYAQFYMDSSPDALSE